MLWWKNPHTRTVIWKNPHPKTVIRLKESLCVCICVCVRVCLSECAWDRQTDRYTYLKWSYPAHKRHETGKSDLFTWLLMEEASDAGFWSVKEQVCGGAVVAIRTKKLKTRWQKNWSQNIQLHSTVADHHFSLSAPLEFIHAQKRNKNSHECHITDSQNESSTRQEPQKSK